MIILNIDHMQWIQWSLIYMYAANKKDDYIIILLATFIKC